MLLNTSEETRENLMGTPPPTLKISRNTNFEKTCENFFYYLQHHAATVSWFYAGEPMNPNKVLMSGIIFLFGRRTMHSTESEI